MRDLALRDRHQAEIRQLASYLGHPPGIDGFMRDVWRVKPDPADVEYIASPVHQARLFSQFNYLAGDCDDASTLAACLLAALDWPCTLVAIRMPRDREFSHVFCRAPLLDFGPDLFCDIDPIVPAEMLPLTGYEESLEVQVL